MELLKDRYEAKATHTAIVGSIRINAPSSKALAAAKDYLETMQEIHEETIKAVKKQKQQVNEITSDNNEELRVNATKTLNDETITSLEDPARFIKVLNRALKRNLERNMKYAGVSFDSAPINSGYAISNGRCDCAFDFSFEL